MASDFSKLNETEKEDRKFLHDLSTPLIIVRTLMKKIASEITENASEKQQDRIKKVLDAVSKIEDLHADHKALISKRERAK